MHTLAEETYSDELMIVRASKEGKSKPQTYCTPCPIPPVSARLATREHPFPANTSTNHSQKLERYLLVETPMCHKCRFERTDSAMHPHLASRATVEMLDRAAALAQTRKRCEAHHVDNLTAEADT